MGQFGIVALGIVGMLLLMAVLVIVAHWNEKRRTEELRRIADELSFDFLDDDDGVLAYLGDFNLFSQGRARKVRNVMQGNSSNTEVTIFGYNYTTGSGKNSTTHRQSVTCFYSDRLALPRFVLTPESWFHKIGSMLGYQDIDFIDYPEFSRTYLLRGEDEQGVRNLFTATVIEHFESLSGICAEGHGDRLIVYRAGKRIRPIEVRQFLETGFGIYSVLTRAADA